MIFNRTISIYRPTPAESAPGQLQVGQVDYQALEPGTNETLVFADIPAAIQAEALGNTRAIDVPASAPGPVKWSIYLPKTALSRGQVIDRDIVVDDNGDRYQVAAGYWNYLGFKLLTIRLEA